MNDDVQSQVGTFLTDLHARIFMWCYGYQDRHWDARRFGPQPPVRAWDRIKHRLKVFAASRGWAAQRFDLEAAAFEMAQVTSKAQEYARAYALLADAYSKRVFLDVLSYRALGGQHVRMPVNTPEYWRHYDNDHALIARKDTITTAWGWTLNQYDFKGKSGPIHLNLPPTAYLYYFITRCYDYNRQGRLICVRPGDIVIDGGGCWGDTAVMFADESAPGGRVVTLEFVPDNIRLMQANLDLNPRLKPCIDHVTRALGEATGRILEFTPDGPGTNLSKAAKAERALRVETITLDDLVAERKLPRVDFVKMDIESSELVALRGAEGTLRSFKPRLAISIYHKPEDFFEIPLFLHGLGLGYRFYVDHFTVHREETVLFATCDA